MDDEAWAEPVTPQVAWASAGPLHSIVNAAMHAAIHLAMIICFPAVLVALRA
jgi:hypothetical protein